MVEFCKQYRAHYLEINTLNQFNSRALIKKIAREYYQIAEIKEKELSEPIVSKSKKLALYFLMVLVQIGNSLYKYLDFSPILTISWLLHFLIPCWTLFLLPFAGFIYYFLALYLVAFIMNIQDRFPYKLIFLGSALLLDFSCLLHNLRLIYLDPLLFWTFTLFSIIYSVKTRATQMKRVFVTFKRKLTHKKFAVY